MDSQVPFVPRGASDPASIFACFGLVSRTLLLQPRDVLSDHSLKIPAMRRFILRTWHPRVNAWPGICVCDVEMYTPPSWTGIQIRSSSAQRQPRPQIRSSQLNSCASSNYLFAVGLPIVSTCITTNSPRDTESRSSGRHSQGFGCGRQSEMKCCAPSIVRRGPQVASVRFHNGAADG